MLVSAAMRPSWLERLLVRLGEIQTRRPLTVLLLVLATLIPTGLLASRLSLRTEFTELLPDGKRSVIEARRIAERLSGKSAPGAGTGATLSVVAQSENVDALKRFVDTLAPQIRKARSEPSHFRPGRLARGAGFFPSTQAPVRRPQRYPKESTTM